jgi:DNA-directed RNA polymerase subunit RPC12/RpoP
MSISEKDLKTIVRTVLEEAHPQNQAPTENHIDHVCSCPDCLCAVMDKLNKESEYVCENCGFPLGSKKMAEALPDCPNCHGKSVKKIEG